MPVGVGIFMRWLLAAASAVAFAAGARAAEERRGREGEALFEERIEPILVKHCLECHGADRKGDLDLRDRASALRGGASGAVVVPGKPHESLLVEHVAAEVMPPENPLAPEDIQALREWVAAGAWFSDRQLDPYAVTTKKRAGYDWWSLQPIGRPVPPEVPVPPDDLGPVQSIDAFLLAKLAEHGLAFAPPADRATWLRRVTYDLHGLAPTFDEVRAFACDERPDAWERVVDRLLASPRYGERWGRHWLDVVRFAESNGFERDRIRTNFWRYRDYVIAAMNEDMPFDAFAREQLAGDILKPDDPRALIATGFLVAGPKNDVGTVSELEQLITRADELDEFVSATGTTFLGLTIGCARCHDHKFDPIPARDYYSLTAVFSGLDRKENIVASPSESARRAELTRELEGRIADAKSQLRALLLGPGSPEETAGELLPPVASEVNTDSFEPVLARHVRFTVTATNTSGEPCLDEIEVYGPGSDNLALASAGAKASASSLLPGFAIHQVEHLNDGQTGNERSWISREPGRGWAAIDLGRLEMVERIVWSRDRQKQFTDRVPTEYGVEVSPDGVEWRRVSGSERRRPPEGKDPSEATEEEQKKLAARLAPENRPRFRALCSEIGSARRELAALPPLPVSYGAVDGPTRDTFVLSRGEVRSRGEKVGPAALSAVRALDPNLTPSEDSGPARRKALADWITDPANPLTARVIVNRVWHYHFQGGIVGTPSDFGFQGDPPTHPELLDWLASDFVDHGWRLKRLHRMICLSRAYRQSSAASEEALAVDAGNRWLWRYRPWRLDAEALRDSILAASGALDPTVGGPSARLFEYKDGNVPDYVLLPKAGPETFRRAVYLFNIRTFREPLLAAFDCPDPSVQTPRRQQSTTALQALSLMNNAFIFEQAERMAARVRAQAADDASDEVRSAYRLALVREPTDAERTRAEGFARAHGLASLCRVLLNSNEFLYVR